MTKILNYLLLFIIFMITGVLVGIFIYNGLDIPSKSKSLIAGISFLLTLAIAMLDYINGD